MTSQITITIDGGSGVGKGTITTLLAQKLNYTTIDSGAMYRALAYMLHSKQKVPKTVTQKDVEHIQFFYNNSILYVNTQELKNQAVEDLPIRTQENSQHASNYATLPIIRKHVTGQIRSIMSKGGVILEGRDAGSVIYPHAQVKFYIECPVEVRAQRRLEDYRKKGILYTQEEVELELEERDHQDMTRETDPLTIPKNAYMIANDGTRTLEELIEMMHNIVKQHFNKE
ncbi:MAG: (d)CMP kinase [Candidatus Nanoarchaeia archaeon]